MISNNPSNRIRRTPTPRPSPPRWNSTRTSSAAGPGSPETRSGSGADGGPFDTANYIKGGDGVGVMRGGESWQRCIKRGSPWLLLSANNLAKLHRIRTKIWDRMALRILYIWFWLSPLSFVLRNENGRVIMTYSFFMVIIRLRSRCYLNAF